MKAVVSSVTKGMKLKTYQNKSCWIYYFLYILNQTRELKSKHPNGNWTRYDDFVLEIEL